MKQLFIGVFTLILSAVAFGQGYNTGLPMPGLPKSVGPKPMSGSTSVTWATDQGPIAVTIASVGAITVSSYGKVPITKVRNDYSSSPVSTVAYTHIINSVPATATEIEIFDSSGQTLVVAFGAPGLEVDQLYLIPGGNGQIPLLVPAGTNVSVKAVSANATAGELDVNLYQ